MRRCWWWQVVVLWALALPASAVAQPRVFAEIGGRIGGERVTRGNPDEGPLVGVDGAVGVYVSDHVGLVARAHALCPNMYVLPLSDAYGAFIGVGGQFRLASGVSLEAIPGVATWQTMNPIESNEFNHAWHQSGYAVQARASYQRGSMQFSLSTTPIIWDTTSESNAMTVYDVSFSIAYHHE